MPYEKVKEMAPLFFNEELIKYYENDLYASDFNTYKDIILEPFEIYDSGKEISVIYGRFINDEEGRRHWLYPVRYTVEPYILNEDEIPLIFSDVFKAEEQRYRILNVENYDFKIAEEIYSSNGYGELFEQKEYDVVGFSNDEYNNRMLIYPEFFPLFEKATEAWGWFWVDTMPLKGTQGPNGEIIVELKEYNEVDYEGIETLKDLEIYLKTIFSDEKVEGMLKSGRYFDVDDKLCTVAMGRGTNNSYGRIVEVNKNIINDIKIEYTVHVEKFDDYQEVYEEFTFVYEKEGDRWVFTEFPAWW